VIFTGIPDAASQDASEVLKKMDNIIIAPKDKEGKVTMTLTDKNGKEKIREADPVPLKREAGG
jgi:hypothetical protein